MRAGPGDIRKPGETCVEVLRVDQVLHDDMIERRALQRRGVEGGYVETVRRVVHPKE